jgi:putative ABC transport system permease protein
METIDISLIGLIAAFLLIIPALILDHYFDLNIKKDTIVSIGRMSLQLFLVGFFLEKIFDLNYWWLNLLWLGLMIVTAVISTINRIKINLKPIIGLISLSFLIPTLAVLTYFNAFIIRLDFLFEARYLIALGGMLLGNVLSTNIVALNSFYQNLKIQEKFYLYRLAMGATQWEALAPFFKRNIKLAISPTLAKTATIGIVSLPGMMSGQIVSGSSPNTAIKYQISIMIAIYIASILSVTLTLILSSKKSFNKYGMLKK